MPDEQAMSADEMAMLADTVAKVLTETDGATLLGRLGELGWFELWAEQPRSAARALFGQQGRLARTSPVLTRLMGAALTGEDPEAAPPLLLPRTGAWSQDGWTAVGGAGAGWGLLGQADALSGAGDAVLAVAGPDGPAVLRIPVSALTWKPVGGLDPAMGLCAVDASHAPAAATTVAEGAAAEQAWADAVALGRRLLADEMAAVVAEQQRLAVEHARSRTQFGRPIGSFQAVRHKLAEVHVAHTSAELAADEAWDRPEPLPSALAALLAAAAVELANVHCQQVLGGIGFTWEHAFQTYVRRGRVLAALLGTRSQLATRLGSGIISQGHVPDLAEL